MVDLGVSPRGSIHILQMAKALAFLRQRDYVVPEDIKDIFFSVCAHRVVLNAKARVAQMEVGQVLGEIQKAVPAPKAMRGRK